MYKHIENYLPCTKWNIVKYNSGEKGEPGVDCDVTEKLDDVTDKIEKLDRENKVLNEKVSALEKIVEGIVTKLNETSLWYFFYCIII